MKLFKATLASVLLGFALHISAAESILLHADTPQVSQDGHRYTVPSGWSIRQSGALAVMTVPEGGSHLALVDVTSADADANTAVRAAWKIYAPSTRPSLLSAGDRPLRQGWRAVRGYSYASANEKRRLSAVVRQHATGFNVAIFDMAIDIAEKRDAEIELLLGSLAPKGYAPEHFSGVTAHQLTGARLAIFDAFVEHARQTTGVPGVAAGIIQNDKIVMAKGFGVRQLGSAKTVDADTRFMIASNTKPLTTLMLAKLVDAGKFKWDTQVRRIMPSFKLGNAQTSESVLMKHLVCACTGLPRQDGEVIFEGESMTPASVLPLIATMQPTSALGELYQYSNLLAGAAGYIGGQVLHPDMETGAAYDAAMQALVFDPLGMHDTTFDKATAMRSNYSSPHDLDIKGRMTQVDMDVLSMSQVSRPDGGAWSTVNDLLRYLQMELNYGRLPDGSRYIHSAPLLARRVQQVSRGEHEGYGVGLKIDQSTGTLMLHHGGTDAGYISDVMWWPEHDVGAVILTNAYTGGVTLRNVFRRRLVELMFDGNPEAMANLKVFSAMDHSDAAAHRAALTYPVPSKLARTLAPRYRNKVLGDIQVILKPGSVWFDFGGWKSAMAVRKQAAGKIDFVTVSPGIGFEFRQIDKTQLMLSDGVRDYVFVAE
jgi:CubicO group peptidase (beta-lactamase class C family)